MDVSATATLGQDASLRSAVELRLLGGWALTVDGSEVPLPTREQRLIAVLALWRGRRPRPVLAGTLWPTVSEDHAHGSLRVAVRRIKVAVPGLLESSRTCVALCDHVAVDLHGLRRVLALAPCDLLAEPDLLDVLDHDELLPGWYDDWLLSQRDRLDLDRLRLLVGTAQHAFEMGSWAVAQRAASLACRIEPLHDRANEIVVLSRLRCEDRVGAVRALQRYRERLRQDLGVQPPPVLERLVARELGGIPVSSVPDRRAQRRGEATQIPVLPV